MNKKLKQIMINTTAERLSAGMAVKLMRSRVMLICTTAGCDRPDSCTEVATRDGSQKWWLSPNYRVQVPLAEDPILGDGRTAKAATLEAA